MILLEINGKAVEVHTGMRFLKELNKKFTYEVSGISIGFGLRRALIDIEIGDPTILIDLIEAGTRNAKGYKPTTEAIEDFLDNYDGDYVELLKQFEDELKESNATKNLYAQIQAENVEAQAEAKKSTTKKTTKK